MNLNGYAKKTLGERPNRATLKGGSFDCGSVLSALSPEFFDEDYCRRWVLQKIHNGVAVCPFCRKAICEPSIEKFWRNLPCYCPGCRKKFSAATGTAFSSLKMAFRELILLCLLVGYGEKDVDIARTLNRERHAIHRWKAVLCQVPAQRGAEYDR